MSYTTSAALPAIDGTSALSVNPRRLVLIEGGRGHRVAQPCVRADARVVPDPSDAIQGMRFVLGGAVVILAILLACLVVDPLRAAHAREALDALPTASVVVSQGDSLWSIAESCGSDIPTSELVSWIQDRNGIEGGLITAGQTLVVPSAALD